MLRRRVERGALGLSNPDKKRVKGGHHYTKPRIVLNYNICAKQLSETSLLVTPPNQLTP